MPIADVFSTGTGGGTPTIVSDGTKKLVASVDFSTQTPQVFSADGDYTFTTAAGSAVSTLTAKFKYLANNNGGTIQVTGGKLTANIPTTVTSLWALGYWSATPCPFMAFDLRQLSSEILADVNFQKWSVVVEAECDPMFSGVAYNAPANQSLSQINIGVAQGMDPFWAGSATKPVRFSSSKLRSEAATGAGLISNYMIGNDTYTGSTPAFGANATGLNNWSLNTSPYNSFVVNGGPTKISALYNCLSTYSTTSTSTARQVWFANSNLLGTITYGEWSPVTNAGVGSYTATASNDIWGFLSWCRTGNTGTTSWKVSKINVYIVERL